ncbi:tight adherence pilus pseudopilin TadF [Basfia succiniciproducens]|uniref:tight adherence pilus pseudopilin TadF n=1 Tax=Basfia succiniciproducens TaxID=653940 RepID=UPI0008B11F3D|nr:tight adherence pilus pseudopilin TadF [Basfia succiniciproducens]SEQ84143.1 tight adherence protein F [Basfia succiniciproducens]
MNVLHSDTTISPLRRFIRQQRGSVTIEFVFMLILLILILAFMTDLAMLRSTTGRLDNISYSLANILRERTQLYDGKENLATENVNNRDVNNFKLLAKRMAFGDKNSNKEIYVVLEYLAPQNSVYRIIGDSAKCEPYDSLQGLENLSPRSEINDTRKIPLYQVTVCVPNYSFFSALVPGVAKNMKETIRSSSITVSR